MTEILETSSSGEFVAYHSHGAICIARKSVTNYYALAIIQNNVIAGVNGSSGNRFNLLSDVEKADCATILVKLQNGV